MSTTPEHPAAAPTKVRWREVSARLGRNDLPATLVKNWPAMAPQDRPEAVVDAWRQPEWPEQHCDGDLWHLMFTSAGFTVDGKPADRETALDETLVLYRGCTAERRDGMSWTSSLKEARWFAMRFESMTDAEECMVYRVEVHRDQVLAQIDLRGENEYVLDLSELPEEAYEIVL